MTLTFGPGAGAFAARANLRRAGEEVSKSLERLSSGLRINSAADDPGGLALADKLRADARVATVARRNASNGLSMVETADLALEEISNLLYRMSELAEQSSNGVFSMDQRSALQTEFEALGSEINRITATTTYNNQLLISSNSSSVTFQVGITGSATSQISMAAISGTLNSLGLDTVGNGRLTFSIIDISSVGAQAAANTALTAVDDAIESLTIVRGTVGAASSRLESAVNNMTQQAQNFADAESKIRDVDVAEETARLVRNQIIQQAATAILAQANQSPQNALRLLG